MKVLRLPCAEIDGDFLEAKLADWMEITKGSHRWAIVDLYDHRSEHINSLALDKPKARALFNWLAVYLHS